MKPLSPSRLALAALFCGLLLAPKPSNAADGESVETRKVKVRVNPAYPDIARQMNLSGNVNLVLTVAPNGTVKECHAIGGHPVLVQAATDAVKRWRYEPAAQESTISVMFKFQPR